MILIVVSLILGYACASAAARINRDEVVHCGTKKAIDGTCALALRGFPFVEYKVARGDNYGWTEIVRYDYPVVGNGRILDTLIFSIAAAGGIHTLVRVRKRIRR